MEEERSRPIADSDHLSKECWHLMTNGYRKKSASKMGIGKKKVCEEVDGMRIEILGRAGRETRFETRRNAVETLRKICKSVVLCKEGCYVGEKTNEGVGLLEGCVGSLVRVVGELSEGERERFKDEGWAEKLMELRGALEIGGVDAGTSDRVYMLFEEGGKGREVVERGLRVNAAEERQKKENRDRTEKESLEKEKIARAEKGKEISTKEYPRRKKAEIITKEKTAKEKKKRLISLDSDDDIQIVDSW